MKKAMLTLVLLVSCSMGVMAQSNGNNDSQMVNQAIKLLKNAGCLNGAPGQFDATVNVVSACFASGFVHEVVVFTKCSGNNCETFLPAVIGRVFFNCEGAKGPYTVICENN